MIFSSLDSWLWLLGVVDVLFVTAGATLVISWWCK